MTATQGELASLSRYIFRAPDWYSSVTFALVVAAVTGIGAFDSQFILDDAYRGIFYIGIPTLVASFLTTPIDRWLGGQLTYNRSSLLALACEVILVAFLTAAGAVATITTLGQRFVFDVLLEALAVIFAFRLLVVMAVSHRDAMRAAVPASIQTVTAAVVLFVYSGTLRYFEFGGPIAHAYFARQEMAPQELLGFVPQDFALLAVMCLLYSVAVWGLIHVVDRPWRRSLGVSGFDFLRGFIGHIAEGSRELEEFFEEIGEEALVPVTVLSFRRRGVTVDAPDAGPGRFDAGAEKARFVLPMIHPGPMGEIGGGNLPERIAAQAEGLAFPPHATAGHDFNLVTEKEVDSLVAAADRAHRRIEYRESATPSVRCVEGEASVLGHVIGDDALLIATYAPGFADDIDFAVGLSAMAEARIAGVDEVMLVDAHNCNDGLEGDDLGHVTPGSRRSFELIVAAGAAAEALSAAPREPLELGVAWSPTRWSARQGVGPLGIRVAVFRAGDHETAHVLIDGNNMVPGLRERIAGGLDVVDDVEVMTTDTHIVNTVQSVNQVGEAVDHGELVACVRELVDEARADVEPVVAGMASERAAVTVFGNDRTETLASHANVVMAMGGALAGALVIAAVSISVLLFFVAAS